jgi:hypothetical protein
VTQIFRPIVPIGCKLNPCNRTSLSELVVQFLINVFSPFDSLPFRSGPLPLLYYIFPIVGRINSKLYHFLYPQTVSLYVGLLYSLCDPITLKIGHVRKCNKRLGKVLLHLFSEASDQASLLGSHDEQIIHDWHCYILEESSLVVGPEAGFSGSRV